MRVLILVLGLLGGCSSDMTGAPFDVGEMLDVSSGNDMMMDIVEDLADMSAILPRERIECVPNHDPIICENESMFFIGFDLADPAPFEWDCVGRGLDITWDANYTLPTPYPDLEQLSQLKKAEIEMRRVVNINEEDAEYYPINRGLRHLDGLRNLKNGALDIRNNVDLEDVDGLCNLRDVAFLSIKDCPKLKSIKGLRNIRTPDLVIEIKNNPSLPDEEIACLRKALDGTAYVIGTGTSVECPDGYWGPDAP
jgi:hypothetical protein